MYKGHTIGEVVIAAHSADEDVVGDDADKPEAKFSGTLTIPFKNENLFAEHTTPDGHTTVRCNRPTFPTVRTI